MKINRIKYITNIAHAPLHPKRCGCQTRDLSADIFERSKEISFEGYDCEPEKFEIKKLPGIPCACCGKTTITTTQLNEFATGVESATGDDLAKALRKYNRYYGDVEREVVNAVTSCVSTYPNSNIQEILKKLNAQNILSLKYRQTGIIGELKRKAKYVEPNKQSEYQEFLINQEDLINEKVSGNSPAKGNFQMKKSFKRKDFTSGLEAIISTGVKDEKMRNKIREIAEKMPRSSDDRTAFFAKYSKREPREIANRLLNYRQATTEHVKPSSKGGPNNTSNYVVMCQRCNNKRQDTKYSELIGTNQWLGENMQKYMDCVVERIQRGDKTLSAYEDYPSDIQKTVFIESDSLIKLEIPKEHSADCIDINLPANMPPGERIAILTQRRDARKKELEELISLSREYENDMEYQNLVQYIKLTAEVNALKRKRKEASDSLNNKKRGLDAQKRRIANLEKINSELEKPGLTKSDIADLNKRKDNLERGIAANKNAQEEVDSALADYDAANESFKLKTSELEEIKGKIKLPEAFNQDEAELLKELSRTISMQDRIFELSGIVEREGEVKERKGNLEKEIDALREQTNPIFEDGPDTEENRAFLKTYETLKVKREYLQSLKLTDVRFYKKPPSNVSPDFVVEEAKKSVEREYEELKGVPIVQDKIAREEISRLEDEISNCNQELQRIEHAKGDLENAHRAFEEREKEFSEDTLKKKLEDVRKTRRAVQIKMLNCNIETRISAFKEDLAETERAIEELTGQM